MLTATASLLATAPAFGWPVEPPSGDTVRIWLIKRQGTAPRPQVSMVRYRDPDRTWGALAGVGFHDLGRGRRDFADSMLTWISWTDSMTVYPYASHGQTETPGCSVEAACATVAPGTYERRLVKHDRPITTSMYLVAVNTPVIAVTQSPGWTIREIDPRGATIHVTRGQGTAVRIPTVTTARVFTGARLVADRASVAFADIPCFPVETGSATLHGGDKPRPEGANWRQARCPFSTMRGSSSRPTTWTLEGEGTGLTGNGLALVVVTVPAQT